MLTLTKVLPALISSGSFTGSFYGTSSYSKRALTASYAMNGGGGGSGTSGSSGATGTSGTSGNSGSSGTSGTSGNSGTSGSSGSSGNNGSSGTSGGGASLNTGSTYPITSSWSRRAVTASYLNIISQSLIPAKNNTYSLGTTDVRWKDLYVNTGSIYIGDVKLSTSASTILANSMPIVVLNTSSNQIEVPGLPIQLTSSYAFRALTASYILGGGANGSSGTSGATGTSGTSGNNGSSGTSGAGSPGTSGTAGSSGVSATATLQTGSLAKQTVWTNVTSGSTNTITGLSLSSNKWDVSVVEEWDAATLDQYYNSCSLLCHFDTINSTGRFIDNSRNNFTLTSIGNVGLSTTQYKFGGASAYFDGSGDYISTSNTVSNFGTGDFTIECWFYRVSTNTTLISNCTATNTDNNYFAIDTLTANAVITIRDDSNQAFAYGPATTLNEWNHIAVTRNNGTVRVFVNGVSGTPVSITKSVTSRSTIIGGFLYTGFEGYFYGYIDELRITKGVARYTANFTPRNSPFPNSRNQVLTRYVGLVGGIDDKYVDYGVQKLSDTSLKLTRLTYPNQPLIGSGSLSGSVSKVYVNVLDYTNVSVTSSYARNALTASYILGGGANGSSGTSGDSGSSGTSGNNGNNGTSGTSGNNGTSGSSATAGSSGTSGVGTPGTSGTSGSSGTSATAGSSGGTGTSGTSGGSGTNGSSGSSGATGASGSSGTSATAGSSGTSGVGTPGTSGISGSSGTSGSSGANGTSGSSGATGVSGSSGTSGGGASLATGSTYPITSSWSRRSLTASYALNASGGGSSLAVGQTFVSNGSQTVYTLSQTAANRDQILVVTNGVVQSRSGSNYTVSGTTLTLSDPVQSGGLIDVRFINAGQGSSGTSGVNGTVQTGSVAKQTILYNVVSGSQNIITGLNLSGNKWGVDIKEEWDAVIVAGDQYYNSCSLLLHLNGSNGSTTFTDNSPTPKTPTSNNGAAISTAQSKFGGASAYFDGADDYLTITNNSGFDFGSGNFTIEYWEYRTTSALYKPVISRNTSGYPPFMIGWNADGNVYFYSSADGASWNVASAISMGTITTNVWTHYAVTRNGNTFRTFQNGTQISTFTSTATLPAGSGTLLIGGYATPAYFFQGYIDEIRITKGVARYTANFTPQTSEFLNNASSTQYATKYVGLIGGLNDKSVDYGVQKLSDTSLKVVKMTQTTSPFPSGSLSSSVDRVYVNVLDYNKVNVTSSYARNALTASRSVTASYAVTSAPRTVIYRYGTTSVVNAGSYTNTPVKYDTAVTDSTGWYDNTNGRFTPTVAGWYQVSAGARVYGGAANVEGYFTLLKNSNQIAIVGGIGYVFGFISILVYFNGTTDYIQFCSNMSPTATNAQNLNSTPFTMVYMTS